MDHLIDVNKMVLTPSNSMGLELPENFLWSQIATSKTCGRADLSSQRSHKFFRISLIHAESSTSNAKHFLPRSFKDAPMW